ncbi:MAG: hypothetical protein EXQ71_03835 [Acidimicrobiia bacterium]|nr:hypothetical protein [Acidimicrobiia bacterium]
MLAYRSWALLLVALALGPAVAGCGSRPATITVDRPVPPSTFPVLDGPALCDRIPPALVATSLGLDITGATASDSDRTPECTYAFQSASGSESSVSIASLDAAALGGENAFDFVAADIRDAGNDPDGTEMKVAAGDRAVRFTNLATHLAIVANAGYLELVIVPAAASPAEVDTLLVAVANALAE